MFFDMVLFFNHNFLGFFQSYTQSNGKRPFGVSALVVGFDPDGTPRLYQTDPSGIYSAWSVRFDSLKLQSCL